MCLESIPYTSVAFLRNALLVTIFFLYPLFGMVADVWCGRYRMITIGICITWGGAVLLAVYVTFETVFNNIYTVYLITIFQSLQLVGIGIFQASALQFGTDQLKDVSSDQLSSFVHWYIWVQEMSAEGYFWMKVGINYMIAYSFLTKLLLVAVITSFALCFRVLPAGRWSFEQHLRVNPYRLIFGVLRYAWRHKQPVRRSAFTFWEENIPSRIELGKIKYGGPYSNENVEDVKTFFRIAKLLLSLTGFFTCRNGFELTQVAQFGGTASQQLIYRGIITGVLLFSVPLHELVIYPFTISFYPGMLKRTFLGAILTLITVYTTLMLYVIGFYSQINHLEEQTVTWLAVAPNICGQLGYLIFTISLFEFIVAQSPQSMRGLLIGVYYCIAYGFSHFAAWLLYLPFRNSDNATVYLSTITAVGIVGLAIFARVASTYKNRERDEVVNIHIFAESYFDINAE